MANKTSDPKKRAAADGTLAFLCQSTEAEALIKALLDLGVYSAALLQDISDSRTDLLLTCKPEPAAKQPANAPAPVLDYQAVYERERAAPSALAVLQKEGITYEAIGFSSPRLVIRNLRLPAAK